MTDKEDPEVVIDDAYADLPLDFEIVPVEKKEEPKAKTEAAPEKVEKVTEDDPIESLKRQLEEAKAESARERDARIKAESQAREFEGKAYQASGHTLASQIDSVESAIALEQGKKDQARKSYAAAMEIADYDAAAKAQEQLTSSTVALQQLEGGKRELEYRRTQVEKQPPRPADPTVDEMIDGTLRASSPIAQQYISRNRDKLTSIKQINRLYAAHNMAVNGDFVADTPEYFAEIDRQMGWSQQQEDKPTLTRQNRTVAAPVSRDTSQSNGDLSGGKVRLTAEQVAMANELGISPSAYAKNMLRIKANGKDPMADGLRFTSDLK